MEVIEESDEIFKKTLTRWINYKLGNEEEVKDLFSDLRDGLKLKLLLQNLFDDFGIAESGDPFDLVEKSLYYIFKKYGNCNASAELIISGDKNSISELIWHIIYNHEIFAIFIQTETEEVLTGPQAILHWVNEHTPDLEIFDFEDSWRNGDAIISLVNNLLQNQDGQETTGLSALEKWRRSFNSAQASLGIPKLLDAEDQIDDELNGRNLLTYLAVLHNKWSAICEARRAEERYNLSKEKYFNTSRNLLGWIKERTAKLAKELPGDVHAVHAELRALQDEISGEKKRRSLQLSELNELYSAVNHEESFTNYATLNEIDAAWKEMERAERQREYELAIALSKFEHCKAIEAKYEEGFKKRESFLKEIQKRLQESNEVDTEVILRQYEEFSEVGRIALQLLEANHPKAAGIRNREAQAGEKWDDIQNIAEGLDKKLNSQKQMVKIRSIGDYLSVMEKKLYGQFVKYNELYAKLDLQEKEQEMYKNGAKHSKLLNNIYLQCQEDFGKLLGEIAEVTKLIESDIKEIQLSGEVSEELLEQVTCKKLHELAAVLKKECENYKLHTAINKVFEFLRNKEEVLEDESKAETQLGELLEELEAYSLPTELQEQAKKLEVDQSKYELTVLKHQNILQKLKVKLGDLRFDSFKTRCEEFKDWIDDSVTTVNPINYMMIKRGGDKKFKDLNREAEAQVALPTYKEFVDAVQDVAQHWMDFSVAFSEKNRKDEEPLPVEGTGRSVWNYFMYFLLLVAAIFAAPLLNFIYTNYYLREH